MRIVICCTKNWYVYLANLVYSIIVNNNVEKIYLIIEDDKIDYIDYKNIEFININKKPEIIKTTSPNYNTHYSKMSYVRCYFTKLLKDDKILYIDADTLVVDNIEDLWNIDLEDNVIAGVHEPGEWNRHLNTYGLNDSYINSGVLLMDLKKIREERLDDSMIYLLNNNKYAFPDQDVINLVCRNRIKHINNIYNSSETTGIVDNAKILHYIRGNKGWIKSSPRSDIWYKYFDEMIEKRDNMEKYKVKAIISFDDVTVQDENGKNIKRVANFSEWEVDKERYLYLKQHNAVELVEIIPNKECKKCDECKTEKKTTKKSTKQAMAINVNKKRNKVV